MARRSKIALIRALVLDAQQVSVFGYAKMKQREYAQTVLDQFDPLKQFLDDLEFSQNLQLTDTTRQDEERLAAHIEECQEVLERIRQVRVYVERTEPARRRRESGIR